MMYCRSTSTDLKFHGASSVAIEEAVLLLRQRRSARGASPLRLGVLCACRLFVWLVRWRLGPPSDVVPHIHGTSVTRARPLLRLPAPTLEVYPRWPGLGYALVSVRPFRREEFGPTNAGYLLVPRTLRAPKRRFTETSAHPPPTHKYVTTTPPVPSDQTA